jgi:DNA-binding transcriptional ArsR family regulator
MASGRAKALDRLFRALASAPRREILRLAARQKCAVTQFARHLNMSQPAVSKHVRVLVDAALLSKTEELCEALPLISRRRALGPQVKKTGFAV